MDVQQPISSLPPIELEQTFDYSDDTLDKTIETIADIVSQIYRDILGMSVKEAQQYQEKGASFYPIRAIPSESELKLFKGTLAHKLRLVLAIKEPVSLSTELAPTNLLELTTKEILWRHPSYALFPCHTNTTITFNTEEKKISLSMNFRTSSI